MTNTIRHAEPDDTLRHVDAYDMARLHPSPPSVPWQ